MNIQKKVEKTASSMNLGVEIGVEDCWTGGLQKQKVIFFGEGFVIVEPFLHNFQWRREICAYRYDSITTFTAHFHSVAIGYGLTYSYFSHKLEWHGSFTIPLKDYFYANEEFESPSKNC